MDHLLPYFKQGGYLVIDFETISQISKMHPGQGHAPWVVKSYARELYTFHREQTPWEN